MINEDYFCFITADLIGDDEDSLGVLYLILRAVNAFEEQEKRLPGIY